jgi:pimeloyl-ACP methyl ester carboxylesterase
MSQLAAPDPALAKKSRRKRRRRVVFITLVVLYFAVVMFGGCADVLLLHPSKDPIAADGAQRQLVPLFGGSEIEVFTLPAKGEPQAYVMILDGNGGRAEKAVFWGFEASHGRNVEVWSPNYPGFGGSPGSARMTGLAPAALAAYDALAAKAKGKPIVIWGASIGSAPALYVAAHRPVSGLILTNPPPLRQLIMQRYGWWNLWLAAIPVSLGVPKELDSIANAAACKCPALFTSAQADTLVPPDYHRMIIDPYAGPKQVIVLPTAGHDTPVTQAAPQAWQQGIDWLWKQLGQ